MAALKHYEGAVGDLRGCGRTTGRETWRRASAAGKLKRQAAGLGDTVACLETSRLLTEAFALYTSAGYVEVDAFDDEPLANHWFQRANRRGSHDHLSAVA